MDVAAADRIDRRAPDPGEGWAAGFPMPSTLDVARATLVAAAAGAHLGAFGGSLIVRRADEHVVGEAGFHGPPRDDGAVEIGFALVPGARGAGLATEAVGLLCTWALAQPAVSAVTARVEPGNAASLAVLGRCGFAVSGRAGALLRLRRTPAHG